MMPDDNRIAPDMRPAVAKAAAAPGDIPFVYGFCVWGKAYTDLCCDVAFATLLAPNNLPAMPNNAVSRISIVTTAESEADIRAHPIFAKLSALIHCEFLRLPDPETFAAHAGLAKKYQLMTVAHSMLIEPAFGRACAVLLGPDAVFTDGMLPFLLDRIVAGYETVLGHGPRVRKESLLEELRQNYGLGSSEALNVPPREAVRLLMAHEHDDCKILHWSDPNFSHTPYMCVWDPPKHDGMLVRAFSLHPYIMDYRNAGERRILPKESTPVDGTFVLHSLVPWRKIHIVTDSDEFAVLSLTPAEDRDFKRDVLHDPFISLCKWASKVDCEVLHRSYFMHAIRFHTQDLDAGWDRLEQQTMQLAYSVMRAAGRAARWDVEDGVIWDPEFEGRRQALMMSTQHPYNEEFREMARIGMLGAELKIKRYRYAARLLRETDDVLDVSAATGTGSMFLARHVARVTALETRPHDHAVAVAVNNRENLQFRLQSIFDHVPEQPHDAVVALDACEGLPTGELERFIAAAARCLKPTGWLMIGAPSAKVRRPPDASQPAAADSPVAALEPQQLRTLVLRHFKDAQIGMPPHEAAMGWYYFIRAANPRAHP